MTAETAPTRVADDVWRVTTPLPFRPRQVHAYLVRSEADRWMLVDGGVNTDEAWAVLDAAVQRIAGRWDRLVVHLVTHMHLDHQGLSARVRSASGAPLAMGLLDAERAAHAAAQPGEEARYREDLLLRCGVPEDLQRAVQSGRAAADPFSSFVPADYRLPLGIAAVPQLAGWDAVWTPGHTAGHVGLFRAADGLLIAGDAILPRVTPTIGVNRQREDPVGDYLDSLARLEDLFPKRALAGHGEPMERPARRIAELRDATREETERVAALLGSGPASAWEVTRARYPERDLPPGTLMLALRETLAHLQHLVRVGRTVRDTDGNVVRFWLP